MIDTRNKTLIGALYAVAVALLFLVAIRCRLGHELPDDAAFFLRYAMNMAQGQFWVWNLDEAPVSGASAPLFPLLFVPALKWGVAPIPAVLWTSTLVGVLALTWAALLMARHFGYAASCALVALLCLDSNVMHFAGAGLETPLTFLLLVAALHALLAGQSGFWLGVAAGLLAVQKLDLVPFAALLLLAATVAARRIAWRAVAVAALIVAAWYGFAWYWFGAPVPNSFLTKAFHQEEMVKLIGWDWFGEEVFRRHGHWVFTVLALLGVQACWRARKPLLVFCLGSIAAHLLAYSIKYPFEPYDWYFMPALLLLIWLAAVGMGRAAVLIGGCAPRVRGVPAVALAMLCGVIVWRLAPMERQETHERQQWLDKGEYDRAEAGRWVAAHTPPGFKVVTCWGNPAVFSQRYVYDCSFLNRRAGECSRDAHGQCLPEVAPSNYCPAPCPQDLRALYRPEVVIYQNIPDASPAHLPQMSDYEPVRLFDHAFDAGLGNYFFLVYVRKDVLAQASDVGVKAGCLAQGMGACERYLPPPIQKVNPVEPGLTLTPTRGTLCVLETGTQAPADKSKPIEMAGWAVMEDRKSRPDSVWLLFERAGQRYAASASGGFGRIDVVRALGLPPELVGAGFKLMLDASSLAPGAYDVSVVLLRGDQAQACHVAEWNLR